METDDQRSVADLSKSMEKLTEELTQKARSEAIREATEAAAAALKQLAPCPATCPNEVVTVSTGPVIETSGYYTQKNTTLFGGDTQAAFAIVTCAWQVDHLCSREEAVLLSRPHHLVT